MNRNLLLNLFLQWSLRILNESMFYMCQIGLHCIMFPDCFTHHNFERTCDGLVGLALDGKQQLN